MKLRALLVTMFALVVMAIPIEEPDDPVEGECNKR
jgi:hypothetical protein